MSSLPKRPQLAHIPELDGLRGIAALMVLCHHVFFTSVPNPERWNSFVVFLSRISSVGDTGVDLFFVLSGFLITSLLVFDRGSPNYYWNFYWKRALRILPLFFVALLLLVIFSPSSWSYALLSFFFLANFAQVFHVASAGPFWTLAIEEQFYLIWPRLTSKFSAARFNVDRLQRLALTVVVVSPVLRLIAAAAGHHNYRLTFLHCDGLALGAILACQQIRWQSGEPHLPSYMTRPAMQSLLEPVAIALLAVPLVASPLVLSLKLPPESKLVFAADALQVTGISLFAYCLVAVFVRRTGSKRLAIFRWRLLTFFGLISYCLYIANEYAVFLYDHLRGPMQTGNMPQYIIRAAAIFATTLAACILSRYLIELPAMSLRKRVLRQP